MRTSMFTLLCLFTTSASAQYNKQAGLSVAPATAEVRVQVKDDDGTVRTEVRRTTVQRDSYGNAASSDYDLAVDGAFEGQTVFVIDLYHQTFDHAAAALKRKGFSTVRVTSPPSPKRLEEYLAKSNKFWLLANCSNTVALTSKHHAVIKRFFDAGHGVYLWGDNDPCNADADKLAEVSYEGIG